MITVRNHVLLFRERFVEPMRLGRKTHTVRSRRRPARRNPEPGEMLLLRRWTKKPYRSPQEDIIPPRPCIAVVSFHAEMEPAVNELKIWIGSVRLTHEEVCAFVREDGFDYVSDYLDYHETQKPSPLGRGIVSGQVIYWEPPR